MITHTHTHKHTYNPPTNHVRGVKRYIYIYIHILLKFNNAGDNILFISCFSTVLIRHKYSGIWRKKIGVLKSISEICSSSKSLTLSKKLRHTLSSGNYRFHRRI